MAAAAVSIGVGNTDDGVPLQFRTADSNTNDSITHIKTWTTLRTAAGRAEFPLRRRFQALQPR
jgi:hypothetical protein